MHLLSNCDNKRYGTHSTFVKTNRPSTLNYASIKRNNLDRFFSRILKSVRKKFIFFVDNQLIHVPLEEKYVVPLLLSILIDNN